MLQCTRYIELQQQHWRSTNVEPRVTGSTIDFIDVDGHEFLKDDCTKSTNKN